MSVTGNCSQTYFLGLDVNAVDLRVQSLNHVKFFFILWSGYRQFWISMVALLYEGPENTGFSPLSASATLVGNS